jgi:gamma-glutamyltranspeptidase/glutathione hydrolase
MASFLFFSAEGFAVQPVISNRDIVSPVQARNAMVVTGDPIATRIGLEVLKRGGNAVDAAVTIGFVMAVTNPRAGNIGGGGFMLIYGAKTGEVICIDYREKAPAAAQRDMFLDAKGDVDTERSRFSHHSAGVPGTVAGFAAALHRGGTISLAEALGPAIKLAEEGFIVSRAFSRSVKARADLLRRWPSTRKVFFKADGTFYEGGDLFVQKDLARTLRLIAEKGVKAFYRDEIAEAIVKEMQRHGGLITKSDLVAYKPVARKPVHGTYRSHDIYSMSPPSSGGVHIVQILNILEGYDLETSGHNSAATIHLMAEAMRRAYADRSKYLGDPDFFEVPIDWLTSKGYAAQLRTRISTTRATPGLAVQPGVPSGHESNDTTHYAVVDREGNAVSNTYTLNFSFGSGILVEGAGFLLNNEMDDFSAKPGAANAYGLVGGKANAVEPNKRMLSSMSPTIVLKDGKPYLVTGSPGGSRIITTTLQVILNVIDHQMNIQEAVNASRVHHQWIPDEIRIEEGVSPDTVKILGDMGHRVAVKETMGAASSILIDQELNILYGVSDPRRPGLAAGY